MELRKIIRTDIAASALAHLTLVALIILISEVHPFQAAPPETVAIDIVTPEQVKEQETKAEEKEETKDKPLPDLQLPKIDFKDKAEASTPASKPSSPAASPSPAPKASHEAQRQQPQPQASPPPKQQEANAQPQQQATPQPQATQQPQPAQQPPPTQQPQPAQPAQQPPPEPPPPQAPAYQAPQPDVTVKYGVLLGLPPELPALEPKDVPKDDGGDAKDSTAAKLSPEVIAEFRRQLKSCSKLPAGVAPTDAVRIKLRAVMTPDGRLAREPILIEAPPSAKGPLMVRSAMSALQACQPYRMLPVDKYQEWKVMDLAFTPGDFGS